MRFHFPIIIIDEDFRSENASGLGIRALANAIEKEGMEVLGVTSYGDLTSFAQQQSRASAFILSMDDEELANDEEKTIAELRAFVAEIRYKNAEIPLFLHGETRTSRHIPNDILRELHGFIHMHEDTPEFIARHVVREAKTYLDSLPPPSTTRWVVRRKAEVVAAVNGGLLSVDEVCDRYSLTVEEFAGWQRAVDRSGMQGLRVTRIQHYRELYERQLKY